TPAGGEARSRAPRSSRCASLLDAFDGKAGVRIPRGSATVRDLRPSPAGIATPRAVAAEIRKRLLTADTTTGRGAQAACRSAKLLELVFSPLVSLVVNVEGAAGVRDLDGIPSLAHEAASPIARKV